jgi:hypothetical protein
MAERTIQRIAFELAESETRLKLSVARAAWKSAVHYAETCVALEAELVAARTSTGPRNIVRTVKAKG